MIDMIHQTKKHGFTLVELLVSVALMLILVGAVIMIFQNSSEVFSISDAKIFVYQNGRAALELMSREITSADNSGSPASNFTIRNPTAAATEQTILSFRTTTSWIESGAQKSGTTVVTYLLSPNTTDNTLWNLVRRIEPVSASKPDAILAQYIPVAEAAVKISYFKYNSTSKNWDFAEEAAGTQKDFSTGTGGVANLPDAVRISIFFTDRQKRVTRCLSRTVWIPKSINS